MKAFMSTDTIGEPVDEKDAPETIAAACTLAVREARRILAETEPERDAEGWLTAHVPASFPEHGHTELAEALAAFVEGC